LSTYLLLRSMLEKRLESKASKWLRSALEEIADGASNSRFCALISLASRHAPREELAPTERDLRSAAEAADGWNPERWSVLETVRVSLLLARGDLAEESGAVALEEAFRYADEGEARALYRSLALLPKPERFVERAKEGCRTNMRSLFEAVALDTPYPARFFDDVAWRQAVIKCVFIGAPLWRLWGLDGRLSEELARMALDLAAERRSAGREVSPGRRAAVLALARAGQGARIRVLLDTEEDPEVVAVAQAVLALDGSPSQLEFHELCGEG